MGYDRTIVVFSPEGRLYQVEYATAAVKRGELIIGTTFKDGVIISGIKRPLKLSKIGSMNKIHSIDNHIGMACTGLLADARNLVDFARTKSQSHRITYDEPIDTFTLTKLLADQKQLYTQYAGVRPYGVGSLIAGIDDSARLFETDPSGYLREWEAHSIGKESNTVEKYLEKNWKQNMSKKDAIKMIFNSIKKVDKQKFNVNIIDVGIVENKKFRKLSRLKT